MPTDREPDPAAAVLADRLTAMLVQVEQVAVYGQDPFRAGFTDPPEGLTWQQRAFWKRRRREWREAKDRLGEL